MLLFLLLVPSLHGWISQQLISSRHATSLGAQDNFFDGLTTMFNGDKAASSRFCKAKELIKDLLEEQGCFSTDAGALAFGEACALNIVYEDCFEPQPFVGRAVRVLSVSLYEPSVACADLLVVGCNRSHQSQSREAQREGGRAD